MPYGDILLHTGDFTELGLPSEVKKFNDWLGNLPYEYKIVIAGNHELKEKDHTNLTCGKERKSPVVVNWN